MFDNKKTAQHSHIFMCFACLLEKTGEFSSCNYCKQSFSQRERERENFRQCAQVIKRDTLSASLPSISLVTNATEIVCLSGERYSTHT